MVRAVARLVDRERATEERLGLGVSGGHVEQHPELVEQVASGVVLRLALGAGAVGGGEGVGHEWGEAGPVADVLGVGVGGGGPQPGEGGGEGGVLVVGLGQVVASDLLDEAVDAQRRAVGGEGGEREVAELDRGVLEVGLLQPRRRDVEQRAGDRLDRELRQQPQQRPCLLAQEVNAGLPGRGHRQRILRLTLVEGRVDLGAGRLPELRIAREADPAALHVLRRLHQRD